MPQRAQRCGRASTSDCQPITSSSRAGGTSAGSAWAARPGAHQIRHRPAQVLRDAAQVLGEVLGDAGMEDALLAAPLPAVASAPAPGVVGGGRTIIGRA